MVGIVKCIIAYVIEVVSQFESARRLDGSPEICHKQCMSRVAPAGASAFPFPLNRKSRSRSFHVKRNGNIRSRVAQVVARAAHNHEVTGSTPVPATRWATDLGLFSLPSAPAVPLELQTVGDGSAGQADAPQQPRNRSRPPRNRKIKVTVMAEGKIGRPTTFKPEYGDKILELMTSGLSLAASAAEINIDRERVYAWMEKKPEFRHTVKIAQVKRQLFLERRLFSADSGPVVTSTIFALKNASPEDWREKHVLEHSGPDGGAIRHSVGVRGLTDAELEQIAATGSGNTAK